MFMTRRLVIFYVLWIGLRVGSGRVVSGRKTAQISWSGRVTLFPDRVGSQNMDPRAALQGHASFSICKIMFDDRALLRGSVCLHNRL